jgi:hypothetical protein
MSTRVLSNFLLNKLAFTFTAFLLVEGFLSAKRKDERKKLQDEREKENTAKVLRNDESAEVADDFFGNISYHHKWKENMLRSSRGNLQGESW